MLCKGESMLFCRFLFFCVNCTGIVESGPFEKKPLPYHSKAYVAQFVGFCWFKADNPPEYDLELFDDGDILKVTVNMNKKQVTFSKGSKTTPPMALVDTTYTPIISVYGGSITLLSYGIRE